MITAILTAAVLDAAVATALSELVKRLRKPVGVIGIDSDGAPDALRKHLLLIERWSSDISFKNMWRSKELQESFVNLDLRLGSERKNEYQEGRLSVGDLINLAGHVVLLGDPGAGKTTSLKKVAQSALERTATTGSAMPVLVLFRDMGKTGTIADTILTILGVRVRFEKKIEPWARRKLKLQIATNLIRDSCGLLLLDGFDELDPATRNGALADVRELCLQLDQPRLILSCRTGDFPYRIDNTREWAIDPLTSAQVRQFAVRWLGATKAGHFIDQIAKYPYSGTEVRPLTLAHLCAIYERTGMVPEKPRTVYRKIVRLFLEEWDEERSVRRHSKYANFAVDRKEEFLEALAYHLTKEDKAVVFTDQDLRQAYIKIHAHFGLPPREGSKVVAEVQSHTGLVIQVAYNEFEFAHKSIQEYLAANHMLRLPSVPGTEMFGMPNEMALCVALSADPAAYFSSVTQLVEHNRYMAFAEFTEPFVHRIVLERVDWIVSEELGVAVIVLFSRTYYPGTPQDLPFPAKDQTRVFLEFIKQKIVAQSIVRVLANSAITPVGNELFIVTVGDRGSLIEECLIDWRFLESVVSETSPVNLQRMVYRSASARGKPHS